jgi:hypothetical protein
MIRNSGCECTACLATGQTWLDDVWSMATAQPDTILMSKGSKSIVGMGRLLKKTTRFSALQATLYLFTTFFSANIRWEFDLSALIVTYPKRNPS